MTNSSSDRVERAARLRWVPIEKMKVSPFAQRDLNQARVDHLAANLDIEQLGNPTVNERGGWFYILDGQHRVEALRQHGWGDQSLQCWVYTDLTDEEMADRFDRLNDTLAVTAFDRFRVRVNAGRDAEAEINRVVRSNGLVVSLDKVPGAIAAVGTLRRVYTRSDSATLGRALRIARDAFGDPGMSAAVIDGMGHLCQRYNGELNEAEMTARLAKVNGGVNGLLGKAEVLRRQTGQPRGLCVAAAAVDIHNAGKGGKKLASWWKQ